MLKQSFLAFCFLFGSGSAYATVDQSTDLKAILEWGSLSQKDCDRYHAGQTDRETTLRCGKFMYFYDSLGIPGLPKGLIDLLRNNAPKTVGKSLQGYGLVADPYSPNQLPVGLAPAAQEAAWATTYTTTCGSCHFGQTPDGRYVVGQPNHKFEFHKLTLTMAYVSELAITPKKELPPSVETLTRPIWNEFFGGLNGLKVIGETIKLLPNVIATGKKPITPEAGEFAAQLPPGVLDALINPGIEDEALVPQRILPLYDIDPTAMIAAGSTHGAMLTSAGGTPDLMEIFKSQGKIAGVMGGKNYFEMFGPEYFKPLEAYILHLKSPKNLATLDSAKIAKGQRIFESACSSCHNGPGYASTRVFTLEEIGTDAAQIWFGDGDKDGKAIKGIFMDSEMTGGVRAPRLGGIWSHGRYLHNGSLSSLEQLFCLDGDRPVSNTVGMNSAGHVWTCEGYSREEKLDLLEFIKSI